MGLLYIYCIYVRACVCCVRVSTVNINFRVTSNTVMVAFNAILSHGNTATEDDICSCHR